MNSYFDFEEFECLLARRYIVFTFHKVLAARTGGALWRPNRVMPPASANSPISSLSVTLGS
jgi:hypothetical protein